MPSRFMDMLVLICGDLTSILGVKIPLTLIAIFLTSYFPISDMIYVNENNYLHAIKIPPNFKKRSRRVVEAWQKPHLNIVFFIWRVSYLMLIKRAEPMNCDISQIHRLCGLAAGSVMITICRFLTFIKFSCLHFGQNRGKFCSIVSFRILSLVLPPQTGHLIHSAVPISIRYLLQISAHNCLFFCSWHIQKVCQQQEKR